MVFESWREHTVASHASRFRKKLALEQRGIWRLLLERVFLRPNTECNVASALVATAIAIATVLFLVPVVCLGATLNWEQL